MPLKYRCLRKMNTRWNIDSWNEFVKSSLLFLFLSIYERGGGIMLVWFCAVRYGQSEICCFKGTQIPSSEAKNVWIIASRRSTSVPRSTNIFFVPQIFNNLQLFQKYRILLHTKAANAQYTLQKIISLFYRYSKELFSRRIFSLLMETTAWDLDRQWLWKL